MFGERHAISRFSEEYSVGNKQFRAVFRTFWQYRICINSLKAEGVFDKSGCWLLGSDESKYQFKAFATFILLMRKSRHSEDDLKPLLKDEEAMSKDNTDPFYTVKE